MADPDIETAQAGIVFRVRAHADLQAGRENGLAGRRVDRAVVEDIRPDEHDAPAIAVLPGGSLQTCPALDHNVAVFFTGSQHWRLESWGTVAASGHAETGKNKLGILVVEQAITDKVVVDRQRRSDEAAGVDLACPAENHAVAVDHIDLTLRVDAAADLRRGGCGIENFVEGDPLSGIGPALRLVEVDRCVATDIERFPVQNSLRAVLFDVHAVARRGRGVRAVPAGLAASENFESAGNQSIRHIVERRGRGPRRRLGPLHALECLGGAGQSLAGGSLDAQSIGLAVGISLSAHRITVARRSPARSENVATSVGRRGQGEDQTDRKERIERAALLCGPDQAAVALVTVWLETHGGPDVACLGDRPSTLSSTDPISSGAM